MNDLAKAESKHKGLKPSQSDGQPASPNTSPNTSQSTEQVGLSNSPTNVPIPPPPPLTPPVPMQSSNTDITKISSSDSHSTVDSLD